jgi:hypothetical protein
VPLLFTEWRHTPQFAQLGVVNGGITSIATPNWILFQESSPQLFFQTRNRIRRNGTWGAGGRVEKLSRERNTQKQSRNSSIRLLRFCSAPCCFAFSSTPPPNSHALLLPHTDECASQQPSIQDKEEQISYHQEEERQISMDHHAAVSLLFTGPHQHQLFAP